MNSRPELTYFDIRGRAEPVRLLLEDLSVKYDDNQISLDDWPKVRGTMPFHRMPIYRDEDLVIPESFAIMSYLGRKFDLLGDDENSRVRCDVVIEAWRDYGNRIANVFGALSKSEAARRDFIETDQPALLADLEKYYLGKSAKTHYWAGNSPTVADYASFHQIEGIKNQFPELFSSFTALNDFHEQFAERPNIRAYIVSSRRPSALFYGPNGKIFPR